MPQTCPALCAAPAVELLELAPKCLPPIVLGPKAAANVVIFKSIGHLPQRGKTLSQTLIDLLLALTPEPCCC
eukprot:305114-Chlamydomonas_euryale.AAC.1